MDDLRGRRNQTSDPLQRPDLGSAAGRELHVLYHLARVELDHEELLDPALDERRELPLREWGEGDRPQETDSDPLGAERSDRALAQARADPVGDEDDVRVIGLKLLGPLLRAVDLFELGPEMLGMAAQLGEVEMHRADDVPLGTSGPGGRPGGIELQRWDFGEHEVLLELTQEGIGKDDHRGSMLESERERERGEGCHLGYRARCENDVAVSAMTPSLGGLEVIRLLRPEVSEARPAAVHIDDEHRELHPRGEGDPLLL